MSYKARHAYPSSQHCRYRRHRICLNPECHCDCHREVARDR